MKLTSKDKRLATMNLQRAVDAATAAINAGDLASMKAAADALTTARNAKRESDAPRTAIERHEAARSSLYAMCHRFSTEHNGGRK